MLSRNLFRTANIFWRNTKSFNAMPQASFATSDRLAEKIKKIRTKNNIVEGTAASEVISNAGLNSFIMRVYKATGVSIVGALAVSQMAVNTGFAFYNPGTCVLTGLVAGLGGIIGSSMIVPTFKTVHKNNEPHHISENSPFRLGLYSMGMAGLGIGAAPLFAKVATINPAILPTSIVITTGLFGASSLYAYTRPKGALLSWGSSLYGALFGMIGLQIAGFLTQMGPNMFSFMLHRADTFIGVGLFSALIAYDTHVAIKTYELGHADHLMVAMDLVLDFWNILTRMVQILSIFSSND